MTTPEPPAREHPEISDAVRVGISLARQEWEDSLSDKQQQLIDDRIDRKIEKMKIWLFGGVLATIIANFIPSAVLAYQFGNFTGEIRTQMANLNTASPQQYTLREHEIYSGGVDRQLEDLERRVERLEEERPLNK